MAFVGKVRTKSGATAVQVARYANGRQEIAEHMFAESSRPFDLARAVTAQIPGLKALVTGRNALFECAVGPSQASGRTESTGSVLLRHVLTDACDQLVPVSAHEVVGRLAFRTVTRGENREQIAVEETLIIDGQSCLELAVVLFDCVVHRLDRNVLVIELHLDDRRLTADLIVTHARIWTGNVR